ncbi:probable beta-D-xylosidase 5 [Camellia sinensis]|uniref:probable beta-D-xylosidase 5 n=1 Tax=Camellia sinensis TaxID=4442 RepID=UPI001035945A|nr:probable beta-D-xylosidase 5 [Camellia sinensis]
MISIYARIPFKYTSPFQGLEKFVSKVSYELGCSDVACSNNNQLKATTEVVAVANAVIVVVGLSQSFEAEMIDRLNLTLPGYQELLVIEATKAAKGPLVLVLSSGLVDLSFANNTKVGEILWVSYPRQAGDDATAQVGGPFLVGIPKVMLINYLVFSKFIMFVPSTVLVRPRDNTNVIVSFNSIDISSFECHNLYLDVVIGLRNYGPKDGTRVVLVFWEAANAHKKLIGTPKRQLVAFERIQLNIEETEKMTAKLDICKQLSIVDWIGLG